MYIDDFEFPIWKPDRGLYQSGLCFCAGVSSLHTMTTATSSKSRGKMSVSSKTDELKSKQTKDAVASAKVSRKDKRVTFSTTNQSRYFHSFKPPVHYNSQSLDPMPKNDDKKDKEESDSTDDSYDDSNSQSEDSDESLSESTVSDQDSLDLSSNDTDDERFEDLNNSDEIESEPEFDSEESVDSDSQDSQNDIGRLPAAPGKKSVHRYLDDNRESLCDSDSETFSDQEFENTNSEDEYVMDQDENDEEKANIDFDKLSPEEQLKMLLEPVEDDSDLESSDKEMDGIIDVDSDSEKNFISHNVSESDLDQEDPEFDEELPTKHNLMDSDEENESGRPLKKIKSSFEKQQEKLAKTIADFEEENLAEKEWMLRGEVAAQIRPINSLLEQDVDFEQICRSAPPVTEEVTQTLEQIIRQRIQDKAWDDVERREAELPVIKAQRPPDVDSEKSQKSLSQIYEDSAISVLTQNNNKNKDLEDEMSLDPKTKASHDEIKKLFAKICAKIDALSSFKFTPKVQNLLEMQIKSAPKFSKK